MQALTLKHPINSRTRYVVGEDEVTRIEALPHGGYEVDIGTALVVVPADRVDYFEQDPRPGQRSSGKVPAYAKRQDDGTWLCLACNTTKKNLHALRIHHGRAHH